MVDLKKPFDWSLEEDRLFLKGVQGNILKGHGRDHSAFLLVTLSPDKDSMCQWIRNFASRITSAADQRLAATRHRTGEDSGGFTSLALSKTGYDNLGLNELPADPRFRYGMKAVRNSRPGLDPDYLLQDIPVNRWEEFYRGSIDILIQLADDNLARLNQEVELAVAQLTGLGATCHVEAGEVLRRDTRPIEHFGYADGISQPLFFTDEIEEEKRVRGAKYWDPGAGGNIVLRQDHDGASGFGSYLVFRKLEQNPSGFAHALKELASIATTDEEHAAALVLGRYRDGRPLVSGNKPIEGEIANDFQYDRDVYGLVCPYHAHIRKANPRGDIIRRYQVSVPDIDFVAFEREHRIARRGITYGSRPDMADSSLPKPEGGVGLLFLACCSRVSSFEDRQTAFDDEHFVRDEIGADPLMGHDPKGIAQNWPTPNANIGPDIENINILSRSVKYKFGSYVTLRGGEYFYAPSLEFLENIKPTNS